MVRATGSGSFQVAAVEGREVVGFSNILDIKLREFVEELCGVLGFGLRCGEGAVFIRETGESEMVQGRPCRHGCLRGRLAVHVGT